MVIWVIIWVVIALVAAVGEVMTAGLFLASLAVAAVFAAILAAFSLSVLLQAIVFGVVGLTTIGFLRPFVVHALGMESHDMLAGPVTHSHLIGRRAVVAETVDPNGGMIRIGQGEFWSARPYNDTDIIPVGTRVEILLVDGLTALVAPVEPLISNTHPDSEPPAEATFGPPSGSTSQPGASGAKGNLP